ncbi:MAG: hypothetical protein V4813_07475 [Gemmatimonadota bacterium]
MDSVSFFLTFFIPLVLGLIPLAAGVWAIFALVGIQRQQEEIVTRLRAIERAIRASRDQTAPAP